MSDFALFVARGQSLETWIEVVFGSINKVAKALVGGTAEERKLSESLDAVMVAIRLGRIAELHAAMLEFLEEIDDLQLAQGEVAKKKVIPQGESFWWGRTRGYQWWNLLIEVRGESPFFRLNIWDVKERIFFEDADPQHVYEFGPKIADYPPKVVGKRDDWR